MTTAAIILAAGAGTRMKSKRPKVAHEMLRKPLVSWVMDAAEQAGADRIVAVVGHMREQVEPLVADRAQVVVQQQLRGTADAVASCKQALEGFDGSVLVLSGDSPLITADTMRALVKTREENDAAVVVLTMRPDDPFGYGRIIRDDAGEVERIVEQKDATPEEAAVGECNSGFYCFEARALFEALDQVGSDNAQGEFYLTDVLEIARRAGRAVLALPAVDDTECLGINSRMQLAQATKIAQRRINAAHMAAGVTMLDPDQVWIGPDVAIAQDVELLPQVFLFGATRIGQDCTIGPNVQLTDVQVADGTHVHQTAANDAII
ncbi:MAG TPA: bifunctional UDP-N-acetylglucosamine diphosphorylase/glucosamine-1-phosphate N-acetyltransferase GlmU [Eggerthellaceae bacterium]|nr:bifunctional UDP-N-acetylglucosamine diphosphorylase/glucosamine-1-phosphate N-acetyltransferase GlmU [Eggerthellaceae bacterium]